jgi:hypothetical protein
MYKIIFLQTNRESRRKSIQVIRQEKLVWKVSLALNLEKLKIYFTMHILSNCVDYPAEKTLLGKKPFFHQTSSRLLWHGDQSSSKLLIKVVVVMIFFAFP